MAVLVGSVGPRAHGPYAAAGDITAVAVHGGWCIGGIGGGVGLSGYGDAEASVHEPVVCGA